MTQSPFGLRPKNANPGDHVYNFICTRADCGKDVTVYVTPVPNETYHELYCRAIEQIIDLGWYVQQDHEGNTTMECPGKGDRIPTSKPRIQVRYE